MKKSLIQRKKLINKFSTQYEKKNIINMIKKIQSYRDKK